MSQQTTKVVTGLVRFSYANVFTPSAMNEGETPKYNVSIIIPKSDTATVERIKAAIEAAKEQGRMKLADKSGKIPANIKLPLRDGDIDRADDPAYADSWFISANSHRKPAVVDANCDPILDASEFYSGCYGRVSLNFYAFNVNSKGIAAGLQNLQKLRDGEPLAGGSTALEDFGGENAFQDDLM